MATYTYSLYQSGDHWLDSYNQYFYTDYRGGNKFHLKATGTTLEIDNRSDNVNNIYGRFNTNNTITLKGRYSKFNVYDIGQYTTINDHVGGLYYQTDKSNITFNAYGVNSHFDFWKNSKTHIINIKAGVKNIRLGGLGKESKVTLEQDAEVVIYDLKGGSGYDTNIEVLSRRATIIAKDDDIDIRLKGPNGDSQNKRLYQIVNLKNEFDINISNTTLNFSDALLEVNYGGKFKSNVNFSRSLIAGDTNVTNSGNTLWAFYENPYAYDTAGNNTYKIPGNKTFKINNNSGNWNTIKFYGGGELKIEGARGNFNLENPDNALNNKTFIAADNTSFNAYNKNHSITTLGRKNGAAIYGQYNTHTIDEAYLDPQTANYNWSYIFGDNNTVNLNNTGRAWSVVKEGAGYNTININGTSGFVRVESGKSTTVNVNSDARNAEVTLNTAENFAKIWGNDSKVYSNRVRSDVQIWGNGNYAEINENNGEDSWYSYTDINGGDRNTITFQGHGRAWATIDGDAVSNVVNMNRDYSSLRIDAGKDNTVHVGEETDNAYIELKGGEGSVVNFNSRRYGNTIQINKDAVKSNININNGEYNTINVEGYENLEYESVFDSTVNRDVNKLTTKINATAITLNANKTAVNFNGYNTVTVKVGDYKDGNTIKYNGLYIGMGAAIFLGQANTDTAIKINESNINIRNATNAHIFGSGNEIYATNSAGTAYETVTMDLTGNNNIINVANNSRINVIGYGNIVNNNHVAGNSVVSVSSGGVVTSAYLADYAAMGSPTGTRASQLLTMYNETYASEISSITTKISTDVTAAIRAISNNPNIVGSQNLGFISPTNYDQFRDTFFAAKAGGQPDNEKTLLEYALPSHALSADKYYSNSYTDIDKLEHYLTWYQANYKALPNTNTDTTATTTPTHKGIFQNIYENIIAARAFDVSDIEVVNALSSMQALFRWFTNVNGQTFQQTASLSDTGYQNFFNQFNNTFGKIGDESKTLGNYITELDAAMTTLKSQELANRAIYSNASGQVVFESVAGQNVEVFMDYVTSGGPTGLFYKEKKYNSFSAAFTKAYVDFINSQNESLQKVKTILTANIYNTQRALSQSRESAKINLILNSIYAVISIGFSYNRLFSDYINYVAQYPVGGAVKPNAALQYVFNADVLSASSNFLLFYEMGRNENGDTKIAQTSFNPATGNNEFKTLADYVNGKEELFAPGADSMIKTAQDNYYTSLNSLVVEMSRITKLSVKDQRSDIYYHYGDTQWFPPTYEKAVNVYNQTYRTHEVTAYDAYGVAHTFDITPEAPEPITTSNWRDFLPKWRDNRDFVHAEGKYAIRSGPTVNVQVAGYLTSTLSWSLRNDDGSGAYGIQVFKLGVISYNLM